MTRTAAVLAAILCVDWANPQGAKTSDNRPAAPEDAPLLVVPGQSVGEVSLGMSRAEVQRIYGPFATHDVLQPATTERYPALGVALMFGEDGGLSAVFGGNCCPPYKSAVDAFKGRTADGLGMGSTRAEVVAVFGEPLRALVEGDSETETLEYLERGIVFTVWRGKVNLLFIRVPVFPTT